MGTTTGTRLSAALLLAAVAAGCSPAYVLEQAGGQIRLLASRRPVDEVLADPATRPAVRERLLLIRETRAWGEREIGLARTDSYETWVDLEGRPLSWLVTACPPDSLRPETWWFPVVGRVPYLGFFSLEDARAERDRLAARGLDVNIRSVPAYSTLGWFSDPVLSTFVEWPAHEAVDTILHETTHATVWIPGGVSINEALADVVGNEGSERFIALRFGPDSAEAVALRRSRDESARFHEFARALHAELKAAYARRLPRAEKLDLKAAILRRARVRFSTLRDSFTLPYYRNFDRLAWNNALVASIAVYREEAGNWRAVLEAAGGGLRAFLEAARAVAKADDPAGALRAAAARTGR